MHFRFSTIFYHSLFRIQAQESRKCTVFIVPSLWCWMQKEESHNVFSWTLFILNLQTSLLPWNFIRYLPFCETNFLLMKRKLAIKNMSKKFSTPFIFLQKLLIRWIIITDCIVQDIKIVLTIEFLCFPIHPCWHQRAIISTISDCPYAHSPTKLP